MAGLCEGGNEPPGSLKRNVINQKTLLPFVQTVKGIIQPTTEVVLNIQDCKEEQLGIKQFHIDLNQHQEHLL
ncbi:hypothetical protein ANN_18066 [Periplaneta americana]|uniref:Uncharacterized protein n=1 Tax=Periplaneta americana TaxID=6978 RepID=A0ABQ8SNV9_PERAM|nr:hypothetical protein ANN_18066 [Periplaneta americana]